MLDECLARFWLSFACFLAAEGRRGHVSILPYSADAVVC